MDVLSVQNLTKTFPKFQLKDVSFTVQPQRIMGFIGRNGAGKTTTLKSILNLVHPDRGSIRFFGLDLREHEFAIKQRIGFIFGPEKFFGQKTLRAVSGVYSRFYKSWDEARYQSYLERFGLDPDKNIKQLSQGMSIKYALALALSHHAELLILDEPTSGLDPVSRDELLNIFEDIVEQEGASILFSTHITSDLDKSADDITYIKAGQIVASQEKESFVSSYRMVAGSSALLAPALRHSLVGFRERKGEFSGLIRSSDLHSFGEVSVQPADLESIMVYTERVVPDDELAVQRT